MAENMDTGDDPKELLNEQEGRRENDRLDQVGLFNALVIIDIELPFDVPHDFVRHDDNIPPVPVVQDNGLHPEDSNEFPGELIQHFRGISVNQMLEILFDIQRLADENKINMFEGINQRSDRNLLMQEIRHGGTYPQQIFAYICRPILGASLYYLLLINQYNQIMILINRNNGREFPKAYRRIGNYGGPESPKQAVMRVFNRQVQVTNRTNGEIYGHVGIGEGSVLGQYDYYHYYLPRGQGNEHVKVYCFVCHIDTNILALTPQDQSTFRDIRFIHLNQIPENMIGFNGDFYPLLENLLSH